MAAKALEKSLLCETSSPLEERITFGSLQLEYGRLTSPGRSARNLESRAIVSLLLPHLSFLLGSEKVGIVSCGGQRGVGHDFDVLSFCASREPELASRTGVCFPRSTKLPSTYLQRNLFLRVELYSKTRPNRSPGLQNSILTQSPRYATSQEVSKGFRSVGRVGFIHESWICSNLCLLCSPVDDSSSETTLVGLLLLDSIFALV